MSKNLLEYAVDYSSSNFDTLRLKTEHTPIVRVSSVKHKTHREIKTYRRRPKQANKPCYDGLTGRWLAAYEIARNFENKVPLIDRDDIRHDIILEIGKAFCRAPLTRPAMIRIASYTVANYYREQHRINDGLDCQHCSKDKRLDCRNRQNYDVCPKAFKLERFSKPIADDNGNLTELGWTIADDKAIDLESWLDASLFINGYCIKDNNGKPVWKHPACPTRLLEIATKIRDDIPLSASERQYISRFRKAQQKALF